MLTKLILIKACTYDLAELDFEYGSAMQLIGGNNVGKSSLIYALNFLFVIDRRQMSFMGKKAADKTTMEYYFPVAEGSFLVFEIKKRGRRYCILVWRDATGDARYLRLDHAYQREKFFSQTEDGALLPESLARLRKRWAIDGIRTTELKNKADIVKTVYHTGKSNDAAVWLRNSGHGRTAEGFSQLYRYLIDTRLIDMRALREILLLADHRKDHRLSYGSDNLSDVDKLRRMSENVRLLQVHREEFENFRNDFRELESSRTEIVDLVLAFHFFATLERSELEEAKARQENELAALQQQISREEDQLRAQERKIGGLEAERGQRQRELADLRAKHQRLSALPERNFLELSLSNLKSELEKKMLAIAEVSAPGLTAAQLEREVKGHQTQLEKRRNERDNLGNWLLHKLAGNEADRRRLAAILHRDVIRMDAESLRKTISSASGEVRIFDGAFELPADWPLPELATPESIATEIEQLTATLTKTQQRLTNVRNREALQGELKELERRRAQTEAEIRLLDERIEVEAAMARAEQSIGQFNVKIEEEQQSGRELAENIRRRRAALDIVKEQSRQREVRTGRIMNWLRKVENFQIDTGDRAYEPTNASQPELDRLFSQLEQQYRRSRELVAKIQSDFSALKRALNEEIASETDFIEKIEQDYSSLETLQSSVDDMVRSVSQRFATPAADFLNQYQRFREFINQKFNRSLARISISNIESLRVELVPNHSLHRDLERIKELDLTSDGLFSKREQGGMKVLRQYMEQGKEILFSDLFSLQLKLSINGKEKTVDLAKQVESDGTDRMLRLVLVMQVISRLAVVEPDNRIVIFIDEIATIDSKNRPQLVKFCHENHFYPIFAAPEMVEGFDRYVLIKRSPEGALVVEADKHYLDVERT